MIEQYMGSPAEGFVLDVLDMCGFDVVVVGIFSLSQCILLEPHML